MENKKMKKGRKEGREKWGPGALGQVWLRENKGERRIRKRRRREGRRRERGGKGRRARRGKAGRERGEGSGIEVGLAERKTWEGGGEERREGKAEEKGGREGGEEEKGEERGGSETVLWQPCGGRRYGAEKRMEEKGGGEEAWEAKEMGEGERRGGDSPEGCRSWNLVADDGGVRSRGGGAG